MKFVFIDEFKIPKTIDGKKKQWYGLSACVIDSSFYEKYKEGFVSAFKNLKWGDKELKGRYVYSKKGNKEITVDERINFAKKLFNLSQSKTGKNSIIHAYVAFDLFEANQSEEDIYTGLLTSIIKKIPGATSKKGDKNLIAIFLDDNECLTEENVVSAVQKNLKGKNTLFERPFFIFSSNLTPGIILTDFVCYLHQNYLQLKDFTESTKKEFQYLVDKLDKNSISSAETDILKRHLINFKKADQTKELLAILSRINYV